MHDRDVVLTSCHYEPQTRKARINDSCSKSRLSFAHLYLVSLSHLRRSMQLPDVFHDLTGMAIH